MSKEGKALTKCAEDNCTQVTAELPPPEAVPGTARWRCYAHFIAATRPSDAELLAKWRSEREGTKAWKADHYARSLRALPTPADIARANARAKRRKR